MCTYMNWCVLFFAAGWNEKCGSWMADPFNDYCYLFNYLSMRSWADARADCVNQGGDLLSITEPFEQGFIQGVTSTPSLDLILVLSAVVYFLVLTSFVLTLCEFFCIFFSAFIFVFVCFEYFNRLVNKSSHPEIYLQVEIFWGKCCCATKNHNIKMFNLFFTEMNKMSVTFKWIYRFLTVIIVLSFILKLFVLNFTLFCFIF